MEATASIPFLLMTINVLFVCLGNICRSPMAEAIFQQLVDDAGLNEQIRVDSAGTGNWHVGEPAHRGTRRVLTQHGINYVGRARHVNAAEVGAASTYVVAMDDSNLRDLRRRFGDLPNLVRLLDFAQKTAERNVPDPYYEGNFDYVYRLVDDGCRGLLAAIVAQEQLG